MNKQSKEGINIEIINQHNMALHKNKANTIINHQEIKLSQPIKQIAETLINSSIEKPFEWYITNLKGNHINLIKIKLNNYYIRIGMNYFLKIMIFLMILQITLLI